MKIIVASLIILLLPISTHAADKVRIDVPEFNAQFLPPGFAEKHGFFKEDGLQDEIIRINPPFDPQRCAKVARNRPEVKISWIGSNVVEEDS